MFPPHAIPPRDRMLPCFHLSIPHVVKSYKARRFSLLPFSVLTSECSLSSQSVPHVSAALAFSEKRVAVRCGPTCRVVDRARACATVINCDFSGSMQPFPTSPHKRAALAAQVKRPSNLDGHLYEFWYPAEACTITSNASRDSFPTVWTPQLVSTVPCCVPSSPHAPSPAACPHMPSPAARPPHMPSPSVFFHCPPWPH